MEILEAIPAVIYGAIIGGAIVLFVWIIFTLFRPTPAVLNEKEIEEVQSLEQQKNHWLVVVYKKPMSVDLGGPVDVLDG